MTEYQWEVMLNGDPTAKSISVLDLKGLALSDLAGDTLTVIKVHTPNLLAALTDLTLSKDHSRVRERALSGEIEGDLAGKCAVVLLHRMENGQRNDSPQHAEEGTVVTLTRPLLASIYLPPQSTTRQIKVLDGKETLTGLQEFIDMDNIPEYYGGHLQYGGKDSCRHKAPEVLALNEFVLELNKRCNVQSRLPDGAAPLTATSSTTSGTTLSESVHATQKPPTGRRSSSAISMSDSGVDPGPRPSHGTPHKSTASAGERNRRQEPLRVPQLERSLDEEWSVASNTTAASSRSRGGGSSQVGAGGGNSGRGASGLTSPSPMPLTGRPNGYVSQPLTRPVYVASAASPTSTLSNSTGRR
jgi:hypothetical protein